MTHDTPSTTSDTTGQRPCEIADVRGRPILDSRGYPTIEVDLILADGTIARASAPAGASTGAHEAVELRDEGAAFEGRGVTHALRILHTEIRPLLRMRAWNDLDEVDHALAALDATPHFARLGANTAVATSIAACRALAHTQQVPLHRWLAQLLDTAPALPVPHFNIINGGAHGRGELDFQEFMIAPVAAADLEDAIRIGAEVYHTLGRQLRRRHGTTGLGDEGGFAPPITDPEVVLDHLVDAIAAAGYGFGSDGVSIAIDAAANHFHHGDGKYTVNGTDYDRDSLSQYYQSLIDEYPIHLIEDPFAEDDDLGWKRFHARAGHRIQIVGDDLYVTDVDRIRYGADHGYSNAVLIKPNQVGTVTGTLNALRLARARSMTAMVSHRSGETLDTFVADLAVGAGSGQLKAGAPARGERIAKYNHLLYLAETDPSLPYGPAHSTAQAG
ncbi:phosphopyruvate hydratase [Actinomycetospora endophytica]|uniref:Enolase n=1 Tax=Actinomycetospora endophytica TaxID=2291215 RepID=A0ABS8PGG8_9PSEU|nr:phosphopyruvate hydratase [Actinomycetospora endophytica]MCD2197337.1 phosphopyruvate hydratase [Actinomycetospora endophytica]